MLKHPLRSLAVVCFALCLSIGPKAYILAGGCVATTNPLATDAGLAALARGGNAVDAAVAAALTLGVVDGHNSGVGGGCLILLRLADGKTWIGVHDPRVPGKAASR